MGKEQPASYYDDNYAARGMRTWRDYRSVRQRLYEAAAGMIEPGSSIVDLGCGPGHFADYLNAKGVEIKKYDGYDFSQVAIRQAKTLHLPKNYHFGVDDLRSAESIYGFDGEVFVLMEVLEHIEDDLQVLNAIPPGHTCIVSVPEFKDPAHVRTFATVGAVKKRYSKLIDIQEIRHIWKWHLFKGVKK